MSTNNNRLTPAQLRIILERLNELYEEAQNKGDNSPQYDQITIDGIRVKVGYHFDAPRDPITIRIVRKGEA